MKLLCNFFLVGCLFFGMYTVQAYAEIDRFNVMFNRDSVILGEALDLTISAVDKNGQIVSDFAGDIIVYSESDVGADLPSALADNVFTFDASHQGTVKFENAIFYKKTGEQDMFVYLLTDDKIMGKAVVEVLPRENISSAEISITSPETGLSIGEDAIRVSGTTVKNHQVRIFLNGDEKDIFTTSNDEGQFEKNIENLSQGETSIQARVYDKDERVIGESNTVRIQVNSNAPEFKSIQIRPTGEVEALAEIEIEVVSSPGLREVQVKIHEVITKLTEEREGRYTAKSFAPELPGTYSVDVLLKNDFNIETRVDNAAELIVIPKLKVASEGNGGRVETIEKNTQENSLDLTIKNIRVTELKERSIITWDALPDAQSYNIYKKISDTQIELIDSVKESRYEIPIVGEEIRYDYFAIKAIGKTQTGATTQGDLSDMVRIQTGPELYFLLAILALLLTGGIFYILRKPA